jgi:formate-dependent nitrite reductase cytochrome c552 subunit
MAILTSVLAQAQPVYQEEEPPGVKCKACHDAFHEVWQDSAHGRAVDDPIFREAWEAQGKPASCLPCHTTGYDFSTGMWDKDGVACEACHEPIEGDHPPGPMRADRSGELCGECHTETYFEWRVSKHHQVDLDCTDCHDPHETGLKAEDPSAMCANCHKARSSDFTHTVHAQEGLTCADCHLESLENEMGEGRAKRDHSFEVRLDTCNDCHAYQMHQSGDTVVEQPPEPPDAMASVEGLSVSAEPNPISPVGFAMLSGIIGMATGMILAPWLERWYRRLGESEE